MNSNNLEIIRFLDYYIKLPMAPNYGVMLDGPWGCGKTWFINEFMKKLKSSNKNPIYISLYGLSTTSAIDDELYKIIHPILSNPKLVLASKVVRGALKFGLKFDAFGDHAQPATASISIPTLDLKEHLSNPDDTILIFDDLERCRIDINELMGYINHFVEHGDHKVLIVANEDEIRPRDDNEEDKSRQYKRIKEKLIGQSFRIEPDIYQAIDAFILEANHCRNDLTSNKELLISILKASSFNNLRHLRQSIAHFDRLFESLSTKAKGTPALITELMKGFFIYSFECRSGALQPSEIQGLSSRMSYARGKQDEAFEHDARLSKKYAALQPSEQILQPDNWADLFKSGICNFTNINTDIANSSYFSTAEQPKWVQLWHWTNLENADFNSLLSEVCGELESRSIKNQNELLHIAGMLINYNSMGISTTTKEAVVEQAKSCIDKMKERGQLDITKSFTNDLESLSGWNGLGFCCADTDEFQAIKNHLRTRVHETLQESLPGKAQELLELLNTDPLGFEKELLFSNGYESNYCDTPILCHITPSDLIDKAIAIGNSAILRINRTFRQRYVHAHHLSQLASEREWLLALSAEVKLRKLNCVATLQNHHFKLLNETVEQCVDKFQAKDTPSVTV
jgi:hypothetical protein